MATYAKIMGVKKLRKKLDALVRVGEAEIRKAMEASADEIVALAKSLAPVLKEPDARRRAGELRDSIGWTWGRAPKGAMTLGKVESSPVESGFTITIYAGNSEAFYARWVEFGTQEMAAQPFFYPSYRALRKRARGRVSRAINKAARKVAAG